VNPSSSRFTSLFKSHVGVPPARYLRTLRLELARGLLEQTSLSVKEVMAHVGIRDPSHFTRDFRREYGFVPTEVRRRRWTDEEH
jgi:transcriptional regulator GlxA family with amidase domain